METLNAMENLRLLPFIVMFVVAAEFRIFQEIPRKSLPHELWVL